MAAGGREVDLEDDERVPYSSLNGPPFRVKTPPIHMGPGFLAASV